MKYFILIFTVLFVSKNLMAQPTPRISIDPLTVEPSPAFNIKEFEPGQEKVLENMIQLQNSYQSRLADGKEVYAIKITKNKYDQNQATFQYCVIRKDTKIQESSNALDKTCRWIGPANAYHNLETLSHNLATNVSGPRIGYTTVIGGVVASYLSTVRIMFTIDVAAAYVSKEYNILNRYLHIYAKNATIGAAVIIGCVGLIENYLLTNYKNLNNIFSEIVSDNFQNSVNPNEYYIIPSSNSEAASYLATIEYNITGE